MKSYKYSLEPDKLDKDIEKFFRYEENSDFEHLMDVFSTFNYSKNAMEQPTFLRLFQRTFGATLPALKNEENQLKLLDMIVKKGYDLNKKLPHCSRTPNEEIISSCTPNIIKYVLNRGYEFNQYNGDKEHNLFSITFNFQHSDDKYRPELLSIISAQLKKGVDLSKHSKDRIGSFFLRLQRSDELIDLYTQDKYMARFFKENTHDIVKWGIDNACTDSEIVSTVLEIFKDEDRTASLIFTIDNAFTPTLTKIHDRIFDIIVEEINKEGALSKTLTKLWVEKTRKFNNHAEKKGVRSLALYNKTGLTQYLSQEATDIFLF